MELKVSRSQSVLEVCCVPIRTHWHYSVYSLTFMRCTICLESFSNVKSSSNFLRRVLYKSLGSWHSPSAKQHELIFYRITICTSLSGSEFRVIPKALSASVDLCRMGFFICLLAFSNVWWIYSKLNAANWRFFRIDIMADINYFFPFTEIFWDV